MKYINPPKSCDICHNNFDDGIMYDARTVMGPWANMCTACFNDYTYGKLGTGYGQKYQRDAAGDFIKIA